MLTKEQEERLDERLTRIHRRIEWMANKEARAAWIKGFGDLGEFNEEKMRLLDEADEILQALLGLPFNSEATVTR